MERTSAGLAQAMFEEMDALKQGSSTPQQARAKAAIANVIIGVSRLEMEFARFVTDARSVDGSTLQPLLMGTNRKPKKGKTAQLEG